MDARKFKMAFWKLVKIQTHGYFGQMKEEKHSKKNTSRENVKVESGIEQ